MSKVKPPQPPPFFSYTPNAIAEAADALIAASAKVWDHVATIAPNDATFANSIQPIIDDENARLAQGRILYFLSGASVDKDVRAASKRADVALKQDVIERCTRADVFAVVEAVSQRSDVLDLPAESQVYLRKLKQELARNGLAIEKDSDRARLKEINLRLTELSSQFLGNIDADVSGIWLTKEELDGLAPAVLERFKQDDEGKYFVNFKRPNMNAVLSDVHNAGVRRKYYIAWDNRLKEKNSTLLHEILRLRRESALLLGYRNFAESRDQERMLSADRVSEFLDSLKQPFRQLGQEELNELAELKKTHLQTLSAEQKDESSIDAIFRWDSQYYKRLAKLEKVAIDTTKVAEYFSFQLMLPKLQEVYSLLLGLRFVTLSPKHDGVDTWHEDVQVFEVWNSENLGGGFLGYLYVDPYPRDGKYSHVGVFGAQLGYLKPDGTRQYPSAILMANYPPPTQSRPSLMKYHDTVNLFHELGHAVHNLVGRCMYSRFHGSQVTRDYTEIPSRFFEHFFWDPNMIRAVSCHYENPELNIKLPEDMVQNTIATRYDHAAAAKLSDLAFAIFDQVVHTTWEPTEDNELELSVLFNKNRHEYSLLRSVEDLGQGYAALHGQTHFRAIQGAYASSYYTYTT
ncbi:hypothetical protein BKA67DRAFT_521610 [Truncatella angustata]|uniref:Peptidase M3A/M3B catalytic domain-containing protein n=1 Tax=Truncatella angustata TaxID=152316 RepID=A0A9P8UGV1_9PEZI|nr:uncharacterized protein BKA67DRAFT_521610 [Truncatella angustata]KAH6651859.1 hypothetical protein BKA67DRAFT_521610 [Truncatella angustata]